MPLIVGQRRTLYRADRHFQPEKQYRNHCPWWHQRRDRLLANKQLFFDELFQPAGQPLAYLLMSNVSGKALLLSKWSAKRSLHQGIVNEPFEPKPLKTNSCS